MPGEVDSEKPAMEHVAILDEAQRAWNPKQTVEPRGLAAVSMRLV
jgi:hypothetical protein